MSRNYEVIVIGGGMAGAHAAFPLVQAGVETAMIDGGVMSNLNLEQHFQESFEEIRTTRKDQHTLLLGHTLKGLVTADKQSHIAAMTRGNRAYIVENTDKLLPLNTPRTEVLQSLAKGGLSEARGAACDILEDEELEAIGLSPDKIRENYQEVIDRIGISGSMGTYKTLKPLEIDSHAKKILDAYKQVDKKDDLFIKQSTLAVLTEPLNGRKPINYKDLEYHLNDEGAIYRARFTIEELESKENFHYLGKRVVTEIKKNGGVYDVYVTFFDGGVEVQEIYSAKQVICAAGSVNTVRLLLKSCGLYDVKVPFITKTHYLLPCVQWKTLGKKGDIKRHSMCQLFMEDGKKHNGLMLTSSQLYTYKSLMLYKLLAYAPFSIPETLSLLAMYVPSLVLMDTRFPAFQNMNNTLSLKKTVEGETLEIDTKESESDLALYAKELKRIKKFLRKVGLIVLKTVPNAFGSVAHYAGGIPSDHTLDLPLYTTPEGEVEGWNGLYVADTATWKALPARAPALTLMANANKIGKEVLSKIRG